MRGHFNTLLATASILLSSTVGALAWDGTDTGTGNPVEIGKGNLVRQGRDIEVYDPQTGESRSVSVEGIRRSGSSVEVEVYDYESGEYRTLEMED